MIDDSLYRVITLTQFPMRATPDPECSFEPLPFDIDSLHDFCFYDPIDVFRNY